MGVALGGLVVAMAEHLADDLQGDALHDGVAGDGVAEVVDAEVGHADQLAEAAPGAAEAVEFVAGAGADDAAAFGVLFGHGDLAEEGDDLVGDDDVALAGLAVGEAEDAAVPVDLVPLEVADLAVAHAGEGEQADGPDGVGLNVAGLAGFDRGGLGELGLEALALVGGEEALDGPLLEASGALGGVAAGGHVPALGLGEDDAQDGAGIVGGAALGGEAAVEAFDVGRSDLVEGLAAEGGEDVIAERGFVVPGRLALEVHVDVLLDEAFGEGGEGEHRPARRDGCGLGLGFDHGDGRLARGNGMTTTRRGLGWA